MFFLLRIGFWLGLVLVLLPADKPADGGKEVRVDPGQAISAASAAVSDMSQFCDRQPAACAVGGQAATLIGQRAQAGARKLYNFITEKKGDHTGSIGGDTVEELPEASDTLQPSDMRIDWRGPMQAFDMNAPATVSAERG
jgi:hypothetical protein